VVAAFLAEAAAAVARKPHELYELAQDLLGEEADTEAAASVSPLVLSALRQAIKVSRSAKRGSGDRVRIAAFVSGT
jgi:hypothetical protein